MNEFLQGLGITLLVLGGLTLLFWIYVVWYVRKSLLNFSKAVINAWKASGK